MRTAVFSTKPYDEKYLRLAAGPDDEFVFFEARLASNTRSLAHEFPCLCAFVNDQLDGETLEELARQGLRLIALRCAGFNNVDLVAAEANGITVVRVPSYSPHAVAEHAVALMLTLNRQLHRAYQRVRDGNFSLDGLLGFDFHGRTVGVIGTGKIGEVACQIVKGFGCHVVAFDMHKNPNCEALGVEYVDLPTLYQQSDVISLHCPLVPATHHLINADALRLMKPGAMLINTSRGGVIDTSAVIEALKSGKLGSLGIDVYEEEADLFFEDLSNEVIRDDVFARLLTFPNVLVTGHQAFFTADALQQIARTTVDNIHAFAETGACVNAVVADEVLKKP